jgi:tRNA-dihydrouridine synthase A
MMERRISVAPMMGQTDRHFRYMISLIAPNIKLYTPMIHAEAIVNSQKNFIKNENKDQNKVGIQIAGNDPETLARAAAIIEQYNYNEINLNIGCPSERVQNCSVGVVLMKQPELVADIVRHLRRVTRLPVSIKTRIGVDNDDNYEFLYNFINTTSSSGCDHFIIHARKAMLKGLNPKQNRNIPPLDYERVKQIKNDFNDLRVEINGEINSLEKIESKLKNFDGVMIGREAYKNPLFLAEVQNYFFGDITKLSKYDFMLKMIEYIEKEAGDGASVHLITRHMTQLFKGTSGAKQWRNLIGGNASHKRNVKSLIIEILSFLEDRSEILV